MNVDGRNLKLLVLQDRAWAIRARDLGLDVLFFPQLLSRQELESVVLQEGCHGVVGNKAYQLSAPCWRLDTDPAVVLAELKKG